jgi:DNA-binding transcriptional MocR family regulator
MYDRQVDKVRASYRRKRDAMLAALDVHMPAGTTWSRPEGGMFIWVTLPGDIDTDVLLPKVVETANVAYVPGHAFHADGSGKNTLRLSFSLPEPEEITDGIERLGKALSAHL